MTEPKRSLVSGISRLAEAGALFAGDVAGLEVARQSETAGGGALRQPVTLQHGAARSDKLVTSL